MSSDNLLTKFDEMVHRFKQEIDKIVKKERTKMRAEIEMNKTEKLRIKAFEVSDDDIIDLNVGGVKLSTTRSTLCQVEDSLLAAIFSGRWERGLKRDKDGTVFLDYNPQHFALILDYLRAKKIATPEDPVSVPKVPKEQAKHFNDLVQYLGLNEEIIPKAEILPSEKFSQLHSASVSVMEGGKVAYHDTARSSERHDYVLGENVYQHGIVNLKLKLEFFINNAWMFVGVLQEGFIPENNDSFQWSGSYGWALGSYGGRVWKNGSQTMDNTLKGLSKQGDTIELVLHCDSGKLSLHLPTGHQFHIEIPKFQAWRLNVTFFSPKRQNPLYGQFTANEVNYGKSIIKSKK